MNARAIRAGASTTAERMLLAERLALLLLDPHRGRVQAGGAPAPQTLFAAALLADLAVAGRLAARGAQLQCDGTLPLAHPLLAELQGALGASAWPPQRALDRARRSLPHLSRRLLDGLARRDLLHRLPRLRLVPRAGYRYPLRSQQAHAEAANELARAAGLATTPNDYALLLLADAACLLKRLTSGMHASAYAALARLDADEMPVDPALGALTLLRRALLDS